MKTYCISVVIALAAVATAQTRYNVTYTAPLTGGEYAFASGVNDAGVMVGLSRYWPVGVNPHERGFISNGSRTRMLDNLSTAHPNSEAYDINNNTDVVGYAYD